jgi:hypothetical protein
MLRTRILGFPQFSVSSVAKASASRSMASASFNQKPGTLSRRRARPGLKRLRGRVHRSVDLRRRGIRQLNNRLLGLGIVTASAASAPATNFDPISIFVSSINSPPLVARYGTADARSRAATDSKM